MARSLAKGDTRLIINECKKAGLLRNQAAYVLATAWHETGGTMKPVRETFAKTDAGAKAALTKAWKAGKLPNVKADYWSGGYYGRGYPQTTHLSNYRWASEVTGVDLVKNPDRMMEPAIAVKVMLVGMIEGRFRQGHTLKRYLTLGRSDFVNAREIINGDKKRNGAKIAAYAEDYDALLKAEGYGVARPASTPTPDPAPIPAAQPKPAPAPVLTVEQRILLMPEADALKEEWPAPPEMTGFRRVVFAVQSQLKKLKYPPGGLDGKWGPLTEEALLAAQKANGVFPSGKVDEATVKGVLGWKEREFVEARENATSEKVEQTVPVAKENAKTKWWSKIGAWFGLGVGGVGTVGQVVEATGQAKTIMETVRDYLPSPSAILLSVVFLVILFFVLRSANKAGEQTVQDVRSGALR